MFKDSKQCVSFCLSQRFYRNGNRHLIAIPPHLQMLRELCAQLQVSCRGRHIGISCFSNTRVTLSKMAIPVYYGFNLAMSVVIPSYLL